MKVFKRFIGAGTTVFVTCLFVGSVLGLAAGVNSRDTLLLLAGVIFLLSGLGISIFIFKSAKYYFRDDYLHIKGINYGHWTDEKIEYKDILFTYMSQYNKVYFFNIVFWYNTQARTIAIPAPSRHIANNQAQKMLDYLTEKVAHTDQSHIISPKFMEKGTNTVIVDWDACLFYDKSQRNSNVYIALFHDGNRMILLGNCQRVIGDKIVETRPPKVEQREFVKCNIFNIAHVNYASVEEAISDVYESADGNAVRVIDCIAEDLRVLPRDVRSIRSRELEKKQFPVN